MAKKNKQPTLEIMHNCPDVFEKMFGNCKQIKLTDLGEVHILPSNYGTFSIVKNN